MNLPNQSLPIGRNGIIKPSSQRLGVTPSGSCGCRNICVGGCVMGTCVGVCA